MEVRIQEGGTKIQLLYVLWVLENFSDENNTLKQDDIVNILEKRGYHTERKSVAKDLERLLEFGYKIHGVAPELDEDGNELPMKRGAIWLEREFSDEQLSLLLNSVAYNVFVEKSNKEELLNNIISLGSKTFKEKHSAKSLVNGGRIYQVEGRTLLEQLKVIEKAIETEKKIRFKYASKLKREGNSFVYEKNKEYLVSPYWIVSKNGNLYLVCYDHDTNDIWNCRIDKIKDVEITKATLTDKNNTELKDISVGTYVSKHPNMFTGDPISIELMVDKTRIGHVCDAFDKVTPLSETEDYITVQVTCGELDMFYWAVQYGGFVEVIKPQSLREKIRIHIERMSFNYKVREGDKYSLAIKNAIRTNVLDLSGIDLQGKTEHYELRHVEKVYLSNNNIDNVDFLKEYYGLHELYLENNPITDINVLANLHGLRTIILRNLNLNNIDFIKDKNFNKLELDLDRDTDLSALAKTNSKKVQLSQTCAYNQTIPWGDLDKNGIKVEVDWESEENDKKGSEFIRYQFPFNFLYEMLGSWHVDPSKLKELEIAVYDAFNKFDKSEQKYLDLRYKKCINSNKDISKALCISEKECENLYAGIKERIEITSICEEFKNYFVPNAINGKIKNMDKIRNFFELNKILVKNKTKN